MRIKPLLNMTLIRTLLLVLCAGAIAPMTLVAQTPSVFPDSDAEFPQAFIDYVAKSKRLESTEAGARFQEAYNSMGSDMKADVKATANAMLTNKVRNYPVFTDYANVVHLIVSQKGSVPQEHITILKELIEAARPSAYKQFESYIEYLPELIGERALRKTNTKLWTFEEGAAYTLSTIDGKAAIHFSKVTIMGMSKADTLTIHNTSGIWFPVDMDWKGKGGTMYFTRAGWSEQDVEATLSNYVMPLDQADFTFDSVTFKMPNYLERPVLGRLEDKLYSTKPQSISNPSFESYATDLNIRNIDERLTTSGGFRLDGRKMVIRGTINAPAMVVLTTNGVKQVQAEARRFLVKPETQEVLAEDAHVILYMKKDSIQHPSLIFRYFMEPNSITLQRSEGIASNLPFKSSWHEMNLSVNDLTWNLDEDNIKLKTISTYTKNEVAFTSYDHYVPQGEMKYMTLTGRNSLQMIRDLAESYGTMTLDGESVAGMFGYPLRQIENVLYTLTKDGFIHYNPETKILDVDYKTFHYMDAGTGNIDFDHIRFISDPRGSPINATISVDSQAIVVEGVKPFPLSAIKRVTLEPRDHRLVLSEDRDLDMAGKLEAGKLQFKGSGMHFDYEGFKVDMNQVDSMIIFVRGPEMDATGEYPSIPLKSIITGIKGALFVDDPGNKSGLNDYPEYPYFESYDTAYVYFDDNYDSLTFPRDKFYFELFPFTLDSIAKAITDSISFEGRLVSGDIFVPFITTLSVQKDRTLGVDELTPPEGLAMYKGAGKFFEDFHLRKDGLFGDGYVRYRQAELHSHRLEFYLDSLYAKLDTMILIADKGEDVPQAFVSKAIGWWMPYADEMVVQSDRDPFSMYDGQLDFDGDLLYRNGAAYGTSDSGMVNEYRLEGAVIASDSARFHYQSFDIPRASVRLRNADVGDRLVTSDPVKANVDFTTGKGTFETLSDTVLTEIPGPKLITNVRQMEWDMAGKKVLFRNNETGDQYFISTLPVYDSLRISAQTAVYDMAENKLTAEEVNEIGLVDSRVIPAGKRLVIQQGGLLEQLQNATLVLNAAEEYHTITSADLHIRSKDDFSGTGVYAYEGLSGMPYMVGIDEISVQQDTIGTAPKKGEKVQRTHFIKARGIIPEEDHFRLAEQLFYKGKVFLYSNDKDIKFDGYGKLDLQQNDESSWFNLNQGIDPERFSLGIDSLIDETRRQVEAGIFISPGELELYSAVMNPRRSQRDPAVAKASGSLFKGEEPGTYIFGETDAVEGKDPAGSLMYYDDNNGKIRVDGALNWAEGIPMVRIDGFGTLDYDPSDRSATATSVIAVDFPMDEAIWYQLPRDIVEYEDKPKILKYNRPEIKRALRALIPSETEANTIIDDIEAEGMFQLPPSFNYRMLLTDVNLQWDPLDGNFKSTGKIGISAINKYPVDLEVKAYTEFGYSIGSAYINLYFETSSGEWYYFSTRGEKMFVISSDQSFNDAVVNSKEKQIRADKKGPVVFEFIPGNLTSKLTFMQRMQDYIDRTTAVPEPAETEPEEGLIETEEEMIEPEEETIEEIPVEE